MFLHPFQAARDVGAMFYRVSGVNFRLSMDVISRIGVHYGQIIEISHSGGSIDPYTRHLMPAVIAELVHGGYDDISLRDLLD
jgi:hypothetical protein